MVYQARGECREEDVFESCLRLCDANERYMTDQRLVIVDFASCSVEAFFQDDAECSVLMLLTISPLNENTPQEKDLLLCKKCHPREFPTNLHPPEQIPIPFLTIFKQFAFLSSQISSQSFTNE